jgi:glycosyltransferase involved in cell wall biosynthesis
MLRVGLLWPFGRAWLGGTNYFHNLLYCYQKHPDPEVKLLVFTGYPEDVRHYSSDAIEIHCCPQMLNRFRDIPERALRKLLHYDPILLKTMERHRIDLLTHSGVGRQTQISTLHWHADFQDKVYPEYFTKSAFAVRDSLIANVALWGNILLSSHSAALDFRRYYPELASVKTHVLHFSSAGILNADILTRKKLESHFPIHEPYFFLPNQFWLHKNHGVVIEALRQTPADIRVICTGSMVDTRDPTYLPSLLEKVSRYGIERRFVCLGTVPYSTMVSLMHHSLAVLQPSRFEGWSTTVEESKAMWKQIILSNIDVHLEQAPERGIYFSPDSPEELAACLRHAYASYSPKTEEAFAKQRLRHRTTIERDWIETFADILKSISGISSQRARDEAVAVQSAHVRQ